MRYQTQPHSQVMLDKRSRQVRTIEAETINPDQLEQMIEYLGRHCTSWNYTKDQFFQLWWDRETLRAEFNQIVGF